VANELHLSRNRIQSLERTGELIVFNEGSRVLRKAVRDGLRLTINVSPTRDGDRIERSAKSSI
jgi:hypothetical protein